MSRGLKLLLTLSILLNVFLVCAGVSAALWGKREFDEGKIRQPTQMQMAARTLDPAVHDQLRRFMRAKGETIRPDFAAARQVRAKAADLAAQPTFDRAGVSALLAQARASEASGRAKVDEAMLDFMATMSPDQRAKLAPGFKARPSRRASRHAK
jgi:uncharacterized membrane protein